MKIEIDFNEIKSAIEFYSVNKGKMDISIVDTFNMGDGLISTGDLFRIPTTHFTNKKSIIAFNFKVDFISGNYIKLSLDALELH